MITENGIKNKTVRTSFINKKDITILCKVVDNFGDIGVVYRLARALSESDEKLHIRLVISNLESFSAMAEQINPAKPYQIFRNWEIFDWNNRDICSKAFTDFPPSVILECFQCGRPDWLEEILFDKNNRKYFHIINIDYLTAEEYADDFHKLKSGTRSFFVKKTNFMPGFTSKTGGLILDSSFMKSLSAGNEYRRMHKEFSVLIFSYERNFDHVFQALAEFQSHTRLTIPDFTVHIYAAAGKSLPFVKNSWIKAGNGLKFTELPFLPQEEWDSLMCRMNFNFIRGEDSLSRACLSGIPFIWQAYIQEDNYQLVKTDALLKRIEFFMTPEHSEILRRYWQNYNTPENDCGHEDLLQILKLSLNKEGGSLADAFRDFSASLFKNGNLAENLLSFIETLPETLHCSE